MFTGIVEELGKVRGVRYRPAGVRLDILASKVTQETSIGDSISVNGVCLTVVAMNDGILSFDVIPETVSQTTLKSLTVHTDINLERALKVGDRVGGHFVTGHVDCIGVIRSKAVKKGNFEFRVAIPPKFLKDVVRKGSIALDGISLTVVDVKGGAFSVCIIPHTAKETTLGKKHSGDKINVELDILVKKGGQ